MRALLNVGVFCTCAGVSLLAAAQESSPGNAHEIPAAAPRAAPSPPWDAPVVQVSDAMLAPLPPPRQMLHSWPQALELVRGRSTSVASARARVLEASARATQAVAQNLPRLAASGSVRRSLLFGIGTALTGSGLQFGQRVPFPATVWNAGVSLNQSLLNLRNWHDAGTADVTQAAAATQAEDAERLALGALADTIVGVITAERLADVSRVSLRSNLSTLDLTRRRARLGAASAVDVLRTEQEVASNRLDVVQADESARRAREALGMALGYPETWGVAPGIDVARLAADARKVCSPIDSLDQRSDVRAAKLNLEASHRNVASPSLGYAPTLDLQSDFGYTTQPLVRPVQWSVSAVLSVPLFDGGLLAAQRQANSALREVAEQQLTETRRQARLQATQSLRAIEVARTNYEVSQRARDVAGETARLARLAFVHGTGTSFDLVDAARRRRLSEIDVTIREFEVVRARIAALLALSNCDL